MMNVFSGVGVLSSDPRICKTTMNKEFARFTVEIERSPNQDGETWVNEWTVDVNNVDILKRSFETDQMDRGPAAPDVQLPFDICGGQY